MLRRQTLLLGEECRGLGLRVLESFERGDDFVLVGIGRGIAQRFHPVARENRGVLLRAGFGRRDHGAVVFLQRRRRAAAGAGHIDHQLPRGRNPVQQRRQFRCPKYRDRAN